MDFHNTVHHIKEDEYNSDQLDDEKYLKDGPGANHDDDDDDDGDDNDENVDEQSVNISLIQSKSTAL